MLQEEIHPPGTNLRCGGLRKVQTLTGVRQNISQFTCQVVNHIVEVGFNGADQ